MNNNSTDSDGTIASLDQSPAPLYELGDTDVTLTVTDDDGATDSCVATVTVVDDTDPTVTAPAGTTVSTDAALCSASGVTLGAATAGDNCSVSVSDDALGTYPLGNTTVAFTATDGSANSNDATDTATVTVNDNENPSITPPANVAVNNDPGLCTANVNVASAQGTDNCSVTVSGGGPGTYPVGTTAVGFNAIDGSNNTATASINVTVSDNEAPSITPPANVAVNNDPGVCSANVNVASAQGADNCSVTVSGGGPGTYPVGTTAVGFNAIDGSNNTATASINVTVSDNEAPVVTAPADVSVSADAVTCAVSAAVAGLGSATIGDNCSVTVDDDGLDTYGLGTTTVAFTATDGSNNTAADSATVTVTDDTAPANASAECTGTGASTAVSFGPVITSDACDANLAITSTAQTGYSLGATTVTFTATDDAGNNNSATATATVVDTTIPNFTVVSAAQTIECTSPAGTPASYGATAADVCSASVGVVAVPASGSLFGLGATPVVFTATDAQDLTNTAGTTVTVEDTTPPAIASVSANPAVLWPPNHKMRSVSVSVDVSDICHGTANCVITGISSNEPDNGSGDGNTTGDYVITGDLTAELRAERSGNGSGREYKISVRCTDLSGKYSDSDVIVSVPHSQGNGGGQQTASAKGGKKK